LWKVWAEWHNWQKLQGNSHQQTRNQLWTPGWANNFLREAQILHRYHVRKQWVCIQYVQDIFSGGESFSRGEALPLVTDLVTRWLGNVDITLQARLVYGSEVSMGRIRIGYPAGYLWFFWIRIGFGYLFLKKIGSRQEQDICLISITKFPWESDARCHKWWCLCFLYYWFLYSQKIKMICQYVLQCTHHNQW